MRLYHDQPSGRVDRARQLRREASEPERRLFRGFRETLPTHKWRHQVPFGAYTADILCFSERLVIEVDGDTHAYIPDRDAARDRFMAAEGYRVLRVSNNDVMQNLEGVLHYISFSLREKEGARAAPPRGKVEGDPRTKKGGAA